MASSGQTLLRGRRQNLVQGIPRGCDRAQDGHPVQLHIRRHRRPERKNRARKENKAGFVRFRQQLRDSTRIPRRGLYARAYTGWMTNFDPAFFFQRNIRIGNSPIRTRRRRGNIHRSKNGTPRPSCDSPARTANPYPDVNVRFEVFDRNGKRISGAQQKTTVTGAVFVDLPPDSIRQRRVRKHRDRPGRALLQKRVLLSRRLRARGRKVYA